MDSRAKLFSHPAHQAPVAFPVGLVATSVVFDFLALLSAGPSMSAVA